MLFFNYCFLGDSLFLKIQILLRVARFLILDKTVDGDADKNWLLHIALIFANNALG